MEGSNPVPRSVQLTSWAALPFEEGNPVAWVALALVALGTAKVAQARVGVASQARAGVAFALVASQARAGVALALVASQARAGAESHRA